MRFYRECGAENTFRRPHAHAHPRGEQIKFFNEVGKMKENLKGNKNKSLLEYKKYYHYTQNSVDIVSFFTSEIEMPTGRADRPVSQNRTERLGMQSQA